ncbi:MAG: beta-ketoacyl synthase N-terminal-like domain-containing protein [Planctomycetota bacterium]
MADSARRRVVITGTASVSPLGIFSGSLPSVTDSGDAPGTGDALDGRNGTGTAGPTHPASGGGVAVATASLVDRLRAGVTGIGPLTRVSTSALPMSCGGQAWDFTGKISDYGPLEKKLSRTIKKAGKVMCREIEMGVAVAQQALTDAGLDDSARDPDRTGVVYGCDYIMSLPEEYAEGIAACTGEDGNFDFSRWGQEGKPKVNPLWLLKYLPNMPASHIAIYNNLLGPNNSITIREASAGAAIGEAVSTIQRGHADVIVVGATGSRIHPLRSLHASLQEPLAADVHPAENMSRPFAADRGGAVLGEGAGAMILETLHSARQRGATVLGEVVAYASSAVGGADQGGDAFEHAVRTSLRNVYRGALGETSIGDIGHIHAHGLSTPACDRAEAAAIQDVFGTADQSPPVTTAKGHFGNLGAGGGMVEVIASLLSLGGELFPIRNLSHAADDCPINACVQAGVSAGDRFVSANVTPQGQATAVQIAKLASQD